MICEKSEKKSVSKEERRIEADSSIIQIQELPNKDFYNKDCYVTGNKGRG